MTTKFDSAGTAPAVEDILSIDNVAETFGISEVHARQIVHTLRQRLKQILGDLMQVKTGA